MTVEPSRDAQWLLTLSRTLILLLTIIAYTFHSEKMVKSNPAKIAYNFHYHTYVIGDSFHAGIKLDNNDGN